MARGAPYQTAFTTGEMSPRLRGRVDLEKYALGLAECSNLIVLREGPVTLRPGTRFVGECFDSTKRSRLLPFVFSDQQAYALEFSPGKIRLFALEGRVLPPARTFSAIAVANEISITDYTYGDRQGPFRFTTNGTLPTGLAAGTDYYILRLDTNRFSVSLTPGGAIVAITNGTGSGIHTITPQAGVVSIEIDTPYQESDLFAIQHAQSADVLYLVHPLYAPRKLLRLSASQWRLETVIFFDGPYLDENTSATTVTASASTGAITITASAPLFVAGRDEGRLIRISDGTNWGWARIDSVTTDVLVNATVIGGPGIPNPAIARSKWRLGLYYTLNYPRAVTFHEQRLVLAGSPATPQRFDGSAIADFENFAPTGGPLRSTSPWSGVVADDNAYSFTIASDRVNVIAWLNSLRNLIVGTVGGIWPVQASSQLEAISPNSINVRRSSVRGAAEVRPVNVEDATVYASSTARRMFAIVYSFERDSFIPIDLTKMADQVLDAGILQVDYAGDPDSIVWVVAGDGSLAGCTIDFQENVFAWHRHFLGGDGFVESIAVIPAPSPGVFSPGAHANQRHDQLWMIVRRTIAGVSRRYVEFLEDRFPTGLQTTDAYFVDAGLSYAGPPVGSISGLGHLEGKTVSILADGSAHAQKVVSTGQVVLDRNASRVVVGLPYVGKLRTLPLENAGTQGGSSQGARKRSDHLAIRFDRTVGAEIARNAEESGWDPIPFRAISDPPGTPVPLFSGDKVVAANPGWSLEGQHSIRQVQPLPMTVLAIGHRSQSGERGVA